MAPLVSFLGHPIMKQPDGYGQATQVAPGLVFNIAVNISVNFGV
jgi:hypothetical protein